MNFLIRGKVSLPLLSDENKKKKYINDESKKNRRKSFIRKGGGGDRGLSLKKNSWPIISFLVFNYFKSFYKINFIIFKILREK